MLLYNPVSLLENIVLLIQYINNADLIVKNKQIIAISKIFDPDDENFKPEYNEFLKFLATKI